MMRRVVPNLIWIAVGTIGVAALSYLALTRGETINAAWLVTAAVCCYLVAFRFYSRIIASKVFALDPTRRTPSERLSDGRDYVPTNRWIVFGHHFAAIAGPGPLVGPTLAAQFGYLPGALWIIIGVALGGAVQDFVILASSVRRNGKTLGQMAKEEIGTAAGFTALVAVLGIMIVLIAVLALVVVNALGESPWGIVTVGLTIPIALLMGAYMRWIRPHKVLEATAIGLVLLIVALYAGRWVAEHPVYGPMFTLQRTTIAWAIMIYGFAASVLPVWLLLAPRDYLSAFVKIGVVIALAIGVLLVLPPLQMPAVTRFIDGSGPVFAGRVFPFAFITIACGAISGFHSLISSGTTPKILQREPDARWIGYGAMLTESLVATLALIAACVLTPGVYFAINAPAAALGTTVESAAEAIRNWGFTLDPTQFNALTAQIGEQRLLSRTGGAPSLAVGMAAIFSNAFSNSGALAIWYHFAIMFEALFILTTLDAGTRVGRFMLQDLLKHAWAPLGRVSWYPGVVVTSAIFVAMWGYFLYQGVTDPLGGINSLWPLFGIANQLLASVALCVGTTVIIKMGKARYAWITILPLVWLVSVTMSAGFIKIFSSEPRLGFLAHARVFSEALADGRIPAGVASAEAARRLIFNDRLDAFVAGFFMLSVIVILAASAREWWSTLSGRKAVVSSEVPYEPALAMAMERAEPLGVVMATNVAPHRSRFAPRALLGTLASALRVIIGAPDWRRYAAAVRALPRRIEPGGADILTPAQFAAERMDARYSKPGNRCC